MHWSQRRVLLPARLVALLATNAALIAALLAALLATTAVAVVVDGIAQVVAALARARCTEHISADSELSGVADLEEGTDGRPLWTAFVDQDELLVRHCDPGGVGSSDLRGRFQEPRRFLHALAAGAWERGNDAPHLVVGVLAIEGPTADDRNSVMIDVGSVGVVEGDALFALPQPELCPPLSANALTRFVQLLEALTLGRPLPEPGAVPDGR
mmetsp:Transcript_31724/g.73626  ORF Transcript_31724/g.73626 Transcript_31724/m.73626 type:complete len:212 (-) Transcript_31724:390-1025(-)